MTIDDGQSIRLSMPRLVSSEWLKLRSTRAFWIGVAAAFLLAVLGGLLPTIFFTPENPPTSAEAPYVVFMFSTLGVQIAILTLAVLTLGSEYSTGSIRLTFVAAPSRLRVMAAKALVVTVTSAALALATLPISWTIVIPRLNSLGLDTPTGNVVGALGRNVGYLTLLALFAFAIVFAVRSTAVAVGLVLGVVFVVPTLLDLIGGGLGMKLTKLGFAEAADNIFAGSSSAGTMLAAVLTVTVWWAVPSLIGGVAVVRKDA
jgi:ABC-2 type transport system permease protein